jgi:hypothetical protein
LNSLGGELPLKINPTPGMVANAYNLSTWQARDRRQRVPVQPQLHIKTLSQKANKKNLNKCK